ncbi:helix-hairpin-helix domain-containing protein [Desulfosporosinus sp. SB140]|uniref:helix-hairpin-helix domain-containing protein n=1 Tax=Desulfosporosinus paludis TaxID=3115649 RepID=UPI00388F3FA9
MFIIVGKATEQDLIEMGYTSIESLKGQDPQVMYDKHCSIKGCQVDRCQLYVFRCAVYYAENEMHEPEKLKCGVKFMKIKKEILQ